MINFEAAEKLYIFTEMAGVRVNISRLTSLIQHSQKFKRETTSAYLLSNKQRNILRVLFWNKINFIDFSIRIPTGRMKWPIGEIEIKEITQEQLQRLLSGDNLTQSIRWKI